MTTPRDDIVGPSERLRDLAPDQDDMPVTRRAMLEAVTQIDALSARVKELEVQLAAARKSLDQQTQMASEQFCRALRAEQERDEAYERLARFFWCSHDLVWTNDEVADAIRSLASGPEKEEKE